MGKRFEVYRDKLEEFRWRAEGGSDNLADSGEGYKNFRDAVMPMFDFADDGDIVTVPMSYVGMAQALASEKDVTVEIVGADAPASE